MVVGYDGQPLVECGVSRPLLQDTSTKRCFLGREQMGNGDILKEWTQEGRITLLVKPVPLIPRGVVVYVSKKLLGRAGIPLPKECDDRFVYWQRDSRCSETVRVGVVTAVGANQMRDYWALILKNRAMVLLGQGSVHHNKKLLEQAKKTALMARAAAHGRVLRREVHLTYGLSMALLDPSKLGRVFDITFRSEYPDWDFGRYSRKIESMRKALGSKNEGLSGQR